MPDIGEKIGIFLSVSNTLSSFNILLLSLNSKINSFLNEHLWVDFCFEKVEDNYLKLVGSKDFSWGETIIEIEFIGCIYANILLNTWTKPDNHVFIEKQNNNKESVNSPIRMARILICFKDSSPETYNTFFPCDANFWHTCNRSVDFPIPGSPPTKVKDPGTIPPPNTLSSSLIPIRILSSFDKDTEDNTDGSLEEIADVFFPLTILVLMVSSTKLFQALHPGHCPIHLADSNPHS